MITSKDCLLVCRSQLQYDMQNQKRQAALRDYIVLQLERNGGQYPLASILTETASKYDEIQDIITELSILKEGVCSMRSYPNSRFKARLNEA